MQKKEREENEKNRIFNIGGPFDGRLFVRLRRQFRHSRDDGSRERGFEGSERVRKNRRRAVRRQQERKQAQQTMSR